MKVFSFLVWLFCSIDLSGQICVYQDIFHGGVTGGYFKTAAFNVPGFLNVNIEPNSNIRKAYLFVNTYNIPENRLLNFNGTDILLNENEAIEDSYEVQINQDIFLVKNLWIDVTNLISPVQNSYYLIPPLNQPTQEEGVFSGYYLLITYENPLLENVSVSVIANSQDSGDQTTYNITNINYVDTIKNISLAINSEHFCDTMQDGSFVSINGVNIGLIGGPESVEEIYCAGISGAFYYENGTSYGIGNDSANSTMKGNDGLANIESYISDNTSVNILFDYQSNFAPTSNPVYELIFAYSTPCQPQNVTVSPDTTICPNSQVQLSATGGTSSGSTPAYEWWPQKDLSCYDCPNPIFSGDSSRLYTVRIWGSDSCSVVRPIMIHVRTKPKTTLYNQSNSLCADSTAFVNWQTAGANTYSLDNGAFQPAGFYNQLPAGEHLLTVRDEFGCTYDTLVLIDDYSSVVANLSVSPLSGEAPLVVQITNQSTEFTDYSWSVNNNIQPNSSNSFQAFTAGEYTVQLIAWQNDPTCADTAAQTISVTSAGFYILGSSLVSASSNAQNTFSVLTNGTPIVKVNLYDVQGRLLKTKTNLQLMAGSNTIWSASELSDIASEMVLYRIEWQNGGESGELKGKVLVVK